ncbi:hypothetical protein Lser_V15G28214 [Lactuca serriola]
MATKSNIDAHKCCKCKTTKCLKLYCGCFAAESYCTEACSCKECCNRLDYQDTVEVAREQAKVRNPLAFSTKEDKDRNKIGCECRLSMCLKESCKCNKAKVGCQLQCRCRGCKNVHGKREDNFDKNKMNERNLSSVTNFSYIQSAAESSNFEMMIGTSKTEYDLDLPTLDQLELMNQFTSQDLDQFEFMNQSTSQDFNVRHDERKK